MIAHVRDISDYQPTVDWKRERQSVCAVAIKASESLHWSSSHYAAHAREARAVGLPVIPYHFVRVGTGGPKLQVAHLAAIAGPRPAVRPMLDVEDNPNGLDHVRFSSWLWGAVVECERLWGAWPIIYTSPGLWGGFVARAATAERFRVCPLWIAHYGVAHPAIPWPWTSWKLWQWTSGRRDPAIPGRVDDSLLAGPLKPLLLPRRPRMKVRHVVKAVKSCAQ